MTSSEVLVRLYRRRAKRLSIAKWAHMSTPKHTEKSPIPIVRKSAIMGKSKNEEVLHCRNKVICMNSLINRNAYPVLYKYIAGTINVSPPILNHVLTWMAGWKPNGVSRNIVQKKNVKGETKAYKMKMVLLAKA